MKIGELSPMHHAARALASVGFRVLPLQPGAKTPAIEKWQLRASTDLDQVDEWWSAEPSFNIGIATGEDFTVIDLDVKTADGIAEWDDLCVVEHGTSPSSPLTAKTWSNGRHLFFRGNNTIHNSAGKIAPGVDIRGVGGYVVAAPSVVNGSVYEWLVGGEDIAIHLLPDLPPLPEWVIGKCHARRSDPRPRQAVSIGRTGKPTSIRRCSGSGSSPVSTAVQSRALAPTIKHSSSLPG
jgi:bifunctional DNA primase/polymerase-like protein